jgi:hypothetical protein
MHLNPEDFNALISDMGQTVRWRQSFSCPCINPHSGAAKPDCPICDGKGRGWGDPIDCDAGITGQRVQREWAQSGLYESGDVVVSLPSDSAIYAMGQFDRAALVNSSERFSVVLTRGNNDILRFPLLSVTRCFWLNAAGSAIVEGRIPAVDTVGAMTWIAGEPAAGAVYTLEGTRMNEYFCFGMFPSNRGIHHGELLPKKVILRKYDLFGR